MNLKVTVDLDVSSLPTWQIQSLLFDCKREMDRRKEALRKMEATGEVIPWLRGILETEGKISAIKSYRQMSGKSLMESKNFVDNIVYVK